MKSRICYQGACLVLFCLVCLSVPAWSAGLTASLSLLPAPVARGGILTIDVLLNNDTGSVLANTTLHVPLAAGIDQWKAEVRIDGGPWVAYPANGLIALEQIPAWGQMAVDIRVPIELSSPATLTVTAQLLNATGVLVQVAGWVNVLPNVDAGPDLIVDLGASIALNDSSASDGAGPVTYQWTDHGAGGAFDDAVSLHPTYTPPIASGIVELMLTATDSDLGTSSDSLRIRVNATPKVNISGDLTAEEGIRLPIWQATVSDPDGWIADMIWSDGGAGGIFLPSNDVLDPVYLVPEIDGCEDERITLTLQVVDDWGATDSDALILRVFNVNDVPIVFVPDNFDVDCGQRVDLRAIASDEDGWIDAQRWEQVDGADVALHSGSQEEHVWFDAPNVDAPTELAFQFQAVDNCAATASGVVVVRVVPDGVVDEAPILGASLSVTLNLFDERGLPLTAFDHPRDGDVLIVRMTVTNTGQSAIDDLLATLNNGSAPALSPTRLTSWDSATGMIEWFVGSDEMMGELEIVVTVTGR
ncbi:hypothetical protein KKG90_12205, partial [Candidatus Bipolaricaulota bacterium]|nr:hypothetical protein [Candidatus Bipolaricaulota bacterium]